MKKEDKQLRDDEKTLRLRVEAAENNCEKIYDNVTSWLTNVEAEEKNVEDILKDEVKTRCSYGACLNVKRRHQQSHRAKKIAQAICNLRTEMVKPSTAVSCCPRPQELIPTDPDYVMLASRRRPTEELLNALRDTENNVIGIWGMGGVGKTTLAEQVAIQAKEEKLFDEVVMASVTPSSDTKGIQKEIAEKLDMKLDEEIGIPLEECKLKLISRNRDVLIDLGTKKDIELRVLGSQEAWSLFEKMGGNYVKNPNILDTATKVAKKCGGLPVALMTVSRAFKNKNLPQWKEAEGQLQDSFQDRITQLEDATNRLHRVIGALEDSCLLQRFNPSYPDCFNMHGIVRDVGRHIASKNHNMLVVSHEGGWPDIDVLQRCEALSVLSRDICELPSGIECSKLIFFHVNNNYYHSLQMLDDFFKGLKNLRVLDLKRMQLPYLPPSVLVLTNLQTLCLDRCVLGDISLIGELKSLKVLSLHSSNITQLPREIGLLTSLQLLDLSDCWTLEVIPPYVLSSLVKLEELYMRNSFIQWEAEGLDANERKNASLVELKRILSHLTTFEIHIPDSSILPKDLMFENLEKYKILVGDVWYWDWSDQHETSRTLKFKLKTSFQAEGQLPTTSFGKLQVVKVEHCEKLKFVFSSSMAKGLSLLGELKIKECSMMCAIVVKEGEGEIKDGDKDTIILFPRLRKLLLDGLPKLISFLSSNHCKNFGFGQILFGTTKKLSLKGPFWDATKASYDITLRGCRLHSRRQDQRIFGYCPPKSPSYPDQEEEIADRLMLSNSELMLHLIVTYNIDPRRCTSEASFERVKLMVYIVRGVPVDLPSLIFWNIMKEISFEVSGVPYGLLLTNFLDAIKVPSHVGEDRQKPPGPIYLETLRKSRSQLKRGKER
ncbi:hypothetical protein CJ030_MR1G017587 [Morella rubra]|uniref:NB-ARC domain-containing protein n=1 Tax=Morella rubra TaxID=262757 RepID=A0A6A1WVR9_9ROSI|nr:hypothetical protein CJ030_MR1G017587 [Morella rubra]